MKRMHVVISGRVQGVFFRARTQYMARSLSLTGWVKNRPDGYVEAVFEGDDDDLKAMLAWCRQGPPSARVTGVDVYEEPLSERFDSFSIQYF